MSLESTIDNFLEELKIVSRKLTERNQQIIKIFFMLKCQDEEYGEWILKEKFTQEIDIDKMLNCIFQKIEGGLK